MNRWVVLFFILIGLALAGSTQLRREALSLSDKEQKDYKRYLKSRAHDQEKVRRAQLYDMPEEVDFLDNTKRILNSAYMANNPQVKEEMLKTGRRFFVYRYPSDDLQIAGTSALSPKQKTQKPSLSYVGAIAVSPFHTQDIETIRWATTPTLAQRLEAVSALDVMNLEETTSMT